MRISILILYLTIL